MHDAVKQFEDSDAVSQGGACIGIPAVAVYVIAGTKPPTSLTLLPLQCYVRWCDGTHVELYSGGGRACAAGAGLYLPGNQEWLLQLGCVLFPLNCDVPLHCVAPLNDLCSGNFLFLCLVPVFGLVVWCFPRKRQQRSEGPEDQISLRNMEVCEN